LNKAADPDWYVALFSAALDETKDATMAFEMADRAARKPNPPKVQK